MKRFPWNIAALSLAAVLAVGTFWAWGRWSGTVDPGDPEQIMAAASACYGEAAAGNMQVQAVQQQGDYCAALLSDREGTACLLLLSRDGLFPGRYQVEDGRAPFPAGKLKQFRFQTGEGAVHVVCGADLPARAACYQMIRGSEAYTRELGTLESGDLLDVYLWPDAGRVHAMAYLVDGVGNPVY